MEGAELAEQSDGGVLIPGVDVFLVGAGGGGESDGVMLIPGIDVLPPVDVAGFFAGFLSEVPIIGDLLNNLFGRLGIGETDFLQWLEAFNREAFDHIDWSWGLPGGGFPDAVEQRLEDNPQWLEPVDIIDRIDELVNEQLEAGRELL